MYFDKIFLPNQINILHLFFYKIENYVITILHAIAINPNKKMKKRPCFQLFKDRINCLIGNLKTTRKGFIEVG